MALYDLNKELRAQQFLKRVKSLMKNKRFVKLEEMTEKTLPQMGLVHVWFQCYATFTGYTVNYTKQYIFKQVVNPLTFIVDTTNEETGEVYTEIRSMATLTKEELSLCMTKFNNECAKIDLRLPLPTDKLYIREIREAAEKAKEHL
jgi:hypothetical protein